MVRSLSLVVILLRRCALVGSGRLATGGCGLRRANRSPRGMLTRRLTLAALLTVSWHCAAASAVDDRFVAWFADGTKLAARALPQWPVPGSPLRIGDRDWMAAANGARLVRDRQATIALAPPYLELANGDVLRATPLQLAADHQRPPRLSVQLEAPLLPVAGNSVAVRTDRIRRIVMTHAPQGPAASVVNAPGTVVLADGRQLLARAIRWRDHGLAILTPEGLSEVSFGDLTDVVFPSIETIPAVVDDNLWAGSAAGPAIARLHTTDGSILTASRISREQEQSRRRGRVTSANYYYLQPAWSDEPLAVPEEEIAAVGYRAADEAPLAVFPRQTLSERRVLAHRRLADDAAPASGMHVTSGQAADFGIATHAHSALAFDLPEAATNLRIAVGFDVSAGRGGCVRCQVFGERNDDDQAAPAGSPGTMSRRLLWDSGVFEGKDGLRVAENLEVTGFDRVILATELAHADRPPGADPFDIRDAVIWLAPLVKLDLAGGVENRAQSMLSGAADWQLAGETWNRAQLSSRWNLPASHWDPLVTLPPDGELKLTRRHAVTLGSDVVELLTACPVELDDHDFALTVNGQAVPWHNNADRQQLRQWVLKYGRQRAAQGDEAAATADRLAYWWDLQAWRGQEVTLELVLRGRGESSEIAWRGLAIRSAVSNWPDAGQLRSPDVSLLSLVPISDGGASAREAPLADAIPRTRDGEPIRFLGQTFKGGYGLGRNSRISFALAPEYAKFVAAAGCCYQTAGPLRVRIDGRVVWERLAAGSLTPAEWIEIALPKGAKVLTLESAAEGTHYGFSAFASAGFLLAE